MFRCSIVEKKKKKKRGTKLHFRNALLLTTYRFAFSPLTLWCPEQDVDSAGPVHLVLLGNDDGEWRAGSAYIFQSLGQRHFCVEEDQIHHHSQVTDFAAHRFSILPTVVSESRTNRRRQTCTDAHRSDMK